MKKLTALLLMLIISISTCALAAPGDATLLRTGENGYNGGLMNVSEIDGAIYMFSYDGVYIFKSGDAEPQKYLWDEESFEADEDGGNINRQAVVSDGEDIYVICVESEYDYEDETNEVVGAMLRKVFFTDDGKVSADEGIELDWDDMIEDYGDYQYSREVDNPIIIDGKLVFSTYVDPGRAIVVFDLEDGECDMLDVDIDFQQESVESFCLYKDGLLLCMLINYASQDVTATLCSYDMEAEELTKLCEIPTVGYSYPGKIAYSEEHDTVYYIMNGELNAITGMDVETIEAITDMPINYGSSAPLLTSDGFFIAGDYEAVVRRNIDPTLRAAVKLTIHNQYNESIQNAYHAFVNANTDIEVVLASQVEDVVQAMMNRSSTVDVYLLSSNSAAYDAVYNRGYMAELTESEKIVSAVERMYPAMRELCQKDGETVAVPVEMNSQCLSYDPEAFKKLGLSEDDVPTTWVEFFESLPVLYEMIKDDPKMRLTDSYMTVSSFKIILFERMLEDYMTYLSQPGNEFKLDTPLFRGIVEAYEAVDFSELGLVEEDEDMEGVYIDYGVGGEHNQIYGTYSDISPRTYSLESDLKPFIPKLADDVEPFVKANAYLVFVNPFSEHRADAIRFVETIIDEMDGITQIKLMPDENEPVEDPYFEINLKYYDESIDALKAQIEKADEEEKPVFEQQLEEYEGYKQDYMDKYRYSANEESIANYRKNADKILVQRFMGLSEDNARDHYTSLTQYIDGMITADEYIRSIDQKLQMIMLEGN